MLICVSETDRQTDTYTHTYTETHGHTVNMALSVRCQRGYCCGCVVQAYLQESIVNSNTHRTTLDNCVMDVESSCVEDHVTGTGRDDIEAALGGTAPALTNAALQVSNRKDDTKSDVDDCLKCVIFLPRDAMRKRGTSCRSVSAHHARVLYQNG